MFCCIFNLLTNQQVCDISRLVRKIAIFRSLLAKNRTYRESYVYFGFDFVISGGVWKLQWIFGSKKVGRGSSNFMSFWTYTIHDGHLSSPKGLAFVLLEHYLFKDSWQFGLFLYPDHVKGTWSRIQGRKRRSQMSLSHCQGRSKAGNGGNCPESSAPRGHPVMTFICFKWNIRLKKLWFKRDTRIQLYIPMLRWVSLMIYLQVWLSASFSNHYWI